MTHIKIYHIRKSGVFSGNFGTVKRPQKLNLELSFGYSIFSLYVERSKNDVAGLNSSRIEMIFQLKNRELKKWLEFFYNATKTSDNCLQ